MERCFIVDYSRLLDLGASLAEDILFVCQIGSDGCGPGRKGTWSQRATSCETP